RQHDALSQEQAGGPDLLSFPDPPDVSELNDLLSIESLSWIEHQQCKLISATQHSTTRITLNDVSSRSCAPPHTVSTPFSQRAAEGSAPLLLRGSPDERSISCPLEWNGLW